MKKLSPPMRQALVNLYMGEPSWHHLSGRSQMGGHEGTMLALVRRGLVDGARELTTKGERIAAELLND
jgi:hypothetical protein